MGFFSWECRRHECGRSIRAIHAVDVADRWMADAVAITADGQLHTGVYDGYGNVGGWNASMELTGLDDDPDVYHQACWELAGKPTIYRGGSSMAPDQGFFIDPDDNPPDPRRHTGDEKQSLGSPDWAGS